MIYIYIKNKYIYKGCPITTDLLRSVVLKVRSFFQLSIPHLE